MIRTSSDKEYFIEPVFGIDLEEHGGKHPHVVYRRSTEMKSEKNDTEPKCGVTGTISERLEGRNIERGGEKEGGREEEREREKGRKGKREREGGREREREGGREKGRGREWEGGRERERGRKGEGERERK